MDHHSSNSEQTKPDNEDDVEKEDDNEEPVCNEECQIEHILTGLSTVPKTFE